jgi:SAM-dependent methyltransferase
VTIGRDEAEQRLERAMLGAIDLAAIVLGRELGYFRALRDLDHANAGELAAATESNARYAREWLEFMAVSDLIDLYEQSDNPDARRYALRPGSDVVFCDEDGSAPLTQDAVFLQNSLLRLPRLAEAYRDGTGLPFSAFGEAARISQELSTKQAYLRDLATEWLPKLGPLHRRLLAEPGGRVADIGFGGGWSTIALAKAYPLAEIDGLDLDAASVEMARNNAAAERMGDRLRFHIRDAADPELAGGYDLVCAFECLHDFTQPVQVLRAMRALLRPGGAVLVGDPAADETFTAPAGDDVRMAYGYSLFHCLPVGMDGEGAVGTGTVMRPSTVRSYARAAGFGTIEVLEIRHPSWRFFRFTD